MRRTIIAGSIFFLTLSLSSVYSVYALNATSMVVGAAVGSAATAAYMSSLGGAGSVNGAITYADAECNPVIPACPQNTVPGPHGCVSGANKFMATCAESVPNVGTIIGVCILPNKCKGVSAPSLGGGSSNLSGSAGSLMSTLGQIIGQMISGGSGSGSGSSGSSGTTGCTSYTTVSDPTLLNGNPCAIYQPSTQTCSITGETYSSVTQSCACPTGETPSYTTDSCVSANAQTCAVSGQTYSSLTQSCTCPSGQSLSSDGTSCVQSISNSTSTSTNIGTNTTQQCTAGQVYSSATNSCSSCPSGQTASADQSSCVLIMNNSTQATTSGVYLINNSTGNATATVPSLGYSQGSTSGYFDQNGGAGTLVLRTVDTSNNSETAGFYGADTMPIFVSTMIGGWCKTRPWSSGWLGKIFPSSFFDGLCQWAGFQVGIPTVTYVQRQTNTQAPVQQRQQQSQATTTDTAPQVPTLPARVTIWAVPSTVTLGARTTIFWNTQSVQNCTISSPDGSFHEDTLSGGGSTVPLTIATTFTISCLDYLQNPVTDFVTVPVQ